MDAPETQSLRDLIVEAVEQCNDVDLLDLIYKILIDEIG